MFICGTIDAKDLRVIVGPWSLLLTHKEGIMSSAQREKNGKKSGVAVQKERHELTGARDNFVYAFSEGRVVRVARKDWAALYTHLSS